MLEKRPLNGVPVPHNLNPPFLNTKLTGFNSSPNSALFYLSQQTTYPPNHAYFSSTQLILRSF